MKYEKIVELLNEVEKSGLSEFELKTDGFLIRMKKSKGRIERACGNTHIALEKKASEVSVQEGVIIKSPFVGIFHAASGKEAIEVAIGMEVKQGQILGTIEAMKLLNDIVANEAGIISEILVKDEELVEYGQPLFIIER